MEFKRKTILIINIIIIFIIPIKSRNYLKLSNNKKIILKFISGSTFLLTYLLNKNYNRKKEILLNSSIKDSQNIFKKNLNPFIFFKKNKIKNKRLEKLKNIYLEYFPNNNKSNFDNESNLIDKISEKISGKKDENLKDKNIEELKLIFENLKKKKIKIIKEINNISGENKYFENENIKELDNLLIEKLKLKIHNNSIRICQLENNLKKNNLFLLERKNKFNELINKLKGENKL